MKMKVMHTGPGLWVLSQGLLLLYFMMDNGSNVCGIDFNYNNVVGKKEEVEVEKEEGKDVKQEEKEEDRELEEEEGKHEEIKENDNAKSIIGENKPDIEVHFNEQLLRKLILAKFEVQSEEGRSVQFCQQQIFCDFCCTA